MQRTHAVLMLRAFDVGLQMDDANMLSLQPLSTQ